MRSDIQTNGQQMITDAEIYSDLKLITSSHADSSRQLLLAVEKWRSFLETHHELKIRSQSLSRSIISNPNASEDELRMANEIQEILKITL